MEKDIYDKAVEYLTAFPECIHDSWNNWGPLFRSVSDDGCLTQIRDGRHRETSGIVQEIQMDERIPKKARDIKPEHLPVFAEWQRRIDEGFHDGYSRTLPKNLG